MNRILGLMAVFLMFTAAAQAGGASPDAPTESRATLDASASKTMEAVRQAYVHGDADAMASLVHPHAHFNPLDFKNRVSARLNRLSQIDLDFSVDHMLEDSGKILIKIRWHRRGVAQATGQVETSTGEAHLIFAPDDGRMLLLDIQGQNPFLT